MKEEFDILAIGNAIVDVIAYAEEDFLLKQGVAKGSMTLINQEQAEKLYAAMGAATIVSGGSAANSVVGAASFGAKCAFIGRVKADPVGEIFTNDILQSGVIYNTPQSLDSPATARSFILVTPDGERTMNTYLGACQFLGEDDIDSSLVRNAKITYLEGYLWDPPKAKAAFRKAARVAHEAGREVAITLSDTFCVDRYRAEFREMLTNGMVDLVFANEHELKSLYETSDFDSAVEALRQDAKCATITRSEKGALVIDKAKTVNILPVPVERVFDATGAGDAYAAGFLFGYTKGMGYEKAGALGALAASHIIEKIGARPDVPFVELAKKAGIL